MNRFFQPSRRDFLRATTAALAAAQGLHARGAEEEKNYIDAHVHVWTPDTEHYPLAKGYQKSQMSPPSFTPEELFAQCHPQGVTRIVLIQMSYYQTDNRYMLDAIAKRPEVFRGVAIVDENRPDLREEMLRLVGSGVRGFRLIATKDACESWLSSKPMQEMWSAGAEANLNMCLLANPDALPTIGKLCRKFPKTPVVIDHMARIGMTGEIHEADVKNLCQLADNTNVCVKTSAFYALGKKQPPYTDLGPLIRRLRDAFGAGRLMWASDCPFQVGPGQTYAASIDLIEEKLPFLTAKDKDAILRDTAERVFFT